MKRWCLLVICMILLTACWDRGEIEDISFIVGLAVDLAEDSKQEEGKEGPIRYAITFQIATPPGMQQTGGSSETESKWYLNTTSEGETMMEIVKHLAARTIRIPIFDQLKAVLFSEEVAKSEGFPEIFDFFIRYPEIRRNTSVYIVQGDAKKGLSTAPRDVRLPAFYLNRIVANKDNSPRVVPDAQLGDIHESMLSKRSFTALHIIPGKQEVNLNGSAVFSGRNFLMVGILSGEDVEGRNLIAGDYYGGSLRVKIQDSFASYNIRKATSSIKLDDKNPEKLRFTVRIKTEGDISESLKALDFADPHVLEELKLSIEDKILRITESAVKQCQEKLGADVIGLGDFLSRKHPKLWNSIKTDWEEGSRYFSSAEVIIKPEVIIRTTGAIDGSRP